MWLVATVLESMDPDYRVYVGVWWKIRWNGRAIGYNLESLEWQSELFETVDKLYFQYKEWVDRLKEANHCT